MEEQGLSYGADCCSGQPTLYWNKKSQFFSMCTIKIIKLLQQDLCNFGHMYLYCRALSIYSCCSIMTESAAETSMIILSEKKKIINLLVHAELAPSMDVWSALLGCLSKNGCEECLFICPCWGDIGVYPFSPSWRFAIRVGMGKQWLTFIRTLEQIRIYHLNTQHEVARI